MPGDLGQCTCHCPRIPPARLCAHALCAVPSRRRFQFSPEAKSPQDVPENAGLHLKRLRAVVLVVSRGHHDNEIELRDDTNRLPATTKRASPVDLTPIEQGAAEPPEISIEIEAGGVHPRCHRGVDPCFRNDLATVPAAARKDKLADFCHIAWSQAQSPSGIGIPLDPNPLYAGNAQRLEQCRARKFVEGASGSLTDYGRQER